MYLISFQKYTKIIPLSPPTHRFASKYVQWTVGGHLAVQPVRHLPALSPPLLHLDKSDRPHEQLEALKRHVARVFDTRQGELSTAEPRNQQVHCKLTARNNKPDGRRNACARTSIRPANIRTVRRAVRTELPLSFGSGTKLTTRLRLIMSHLSVCLSTSIVKKSCSIMDGCLLRRSMGVVVIHDEHGA